QRGEAFSKRSVLHCHLPLHRPVERARLKRRIVDRAQKNPFLSAVQIAKDETLDVLQEFQENALPAGFLQRDVHSGARRHIIFATNEGLAMLAQAQDWFMDGTFHMEYKPFVQLSIHAF
uniref:RNA helicase n=1 Tax=Macrostomum lignano TaxID=282301 RepID=A0A1I8HMK8_9PLAT